MYRIKRISNLIRAIKKKPLEDQIRTLSDLANEVGSDCLTAQCIFSQSVLAFPSFTVDNYMVTVYTGNKYLAGTDARIFVELFGQYYGQNSGEVELAASKNAFETGG